MKEQNCCRDGSQEVDLTIEWQHGMVRPVMLPTAPKVNTMKLMLLYRRREMRYVSHFSLFASRNWCNVKHFYERVSCSAGTVGGIMT